ncbi:bifunctional methylenetetrahydrofolate dehydrogenase/methenyltetrahydrofolate cyclohydrolase FolD [Candidatus Woesearchaeota archaeon]|nr:bifunctional methylenetetrahydrofolate dehydrogenase/methenyltetrahydrofolate cyclohydrolase FolD [Candidatus Woesearchaeota archaeon]
MAAVIIDGKTVAEKIRARIKAEVAKLKSKPGLAAILVGENPASKVYVDIKRKTCDEVGIYSELYKLPDSTTEKELLQLIGKLNENKKIHAILVQMPLPKHISEEKILAAIALEKDVDGFSPENIGKLVSGKEASVPCTPKGVIRLLEEYKIEILGKNAVVIGRSNIVGKPVALMLLNRDATVTVCHSKTTDLAKHTRNADILVVAAGKPKLVTADMVKEGAVVIDVGINRVDGKLVGDVDFETVSRKAGYITPVPKGVGPMTVAMLIENTLDLFRKNPSRQLSTGPSRNSDLGVNQKTEN